MTTTKTKHPTLNQHKLLANEIRKHMCANSALAQFHTDCLALCEFCRGEHRDTARCVTFVPNFGIVAGENFSVYVHSCDGGHYTRCRATPLRLCSPEMHALEQEMLMGTPDGALCQENANPRASARRI